LVTRTSRSDGSTTHHSPTTVSACDRLWPHGLSKERAHLDKGCKQIASSADLRKWYGHDPDRYDEFARRYRAELDDPEHAAALDDLHKLAAHAPLTLLTATKRSDISEAAVLADLLTEERRRQPEHHGSADDEE
jgi:uncharacterized protein YeaO (DUF488 family)